MRRIILGSFTALLLAVAGCGSDDDPGADSTPQAPSPSSTAPASASASPDSPETGSATAASPSTVAPATGPELAGPLVSLRAPADFDKRSSPDKNGGLVSAKDSRYSVALDDSDFYSDQGTPDSLAKLSLKASVYDRPLKRMPDVTIAGLPAYHLAGADPAFNSFAEEFGFRTQTHYVTITVSTPSETTQTDRDAIVASVLASVTVKG